MKFHLYYACVADKVTTRGTLFRIVNNLFNCNNTVIFTTIMEPTSHKERRQREITALRADIFRVVREIARDKGWEGVSMRKICTAIQYTAPVIYEHFPKGKKQILSELRDQGFDQFKTVLRDAATQAGPNPVDQLAAMAEAAWHFAVHEQDLYTVMFNLEGVKAPAEHQSALRFAGEPVMDAIRALHKLEVDRDHWFFSWWAIVHGHAAIALTGMASGVMPKFRTYVREAAERLALAIR